MEVLARLFTNTWPFWNVRERFQRYHKDVDTSGLMDTDGRKSGSYKRKYTDDGGAERETIITTVIGVTGNASKISAVKKNEDSSVKQKMFKKHCLDWIVMDGPPLNATEKKGFRQLIFSIDDRLNCPSRSTITTFLDDKYKQVRLCLKLKSRTIPAAAGSRWDIIQST